MPKFFKDNTGLTVVELMLGLAILGALIGVVIKLKTFQRHHQYKASLRVSIPEATAFLETYLYVNYSQIDFNAPLFLIRNASKNWECSSRQSKLQDSEGFKATFERIPLPDTSLTEASGIYLKVKLTSFQGNVSFEYPFFFIPK